jgi:hypothetical protein
MLNLDHIEWCRACRDEDRLTPAIVIVWGKLFPPEALGPRCWDHAAEHVDMSRLDQWAVFDLRPVAAEVRAARELVEPLRVIVIAYKDLRSTAWPSGLGAASMALDAYDKVTGEANHG